MNIAFGTAVHALAEARAFGRTEPDAADPLVALITTPLFHVTANNCAAHPFTAAGGTLVLMHRWDPTQALDLIQRERVTNLSGVPTMAREILNHPALGAYDLSSLKTITGGGAQLPPDLVERIDRQASARASTGYGMTEASGTITGVVGEAFRLRPESCGRVLPSFDARVIDDEGSELPPGQVGELCVRGPGVISGYLNRPTDTADAITDGWLRTGDVARIDEQGYIFLVDRKKDMVLRGGENVYCAEVEAALFRHPDVAEACVFGVPDERLGEEVGAAVHLQPGRSSSPDDLRRHVRGLLAGYKAPRYIWISQTPLPRNATGKFMRRELRGHLNILDAG
jgi:long-chain acyl-CoA synthetase